MIHCGAAADGCESNMTLALVIPSIFSRPMDRMALIFRDSRNERNIEQTMLKHIFVNEPHDLTAQVSSVKGIPAGKGRSGLDSLQEIFGPGHVRELVIQYHDANHKATAELRLRNGHPAFGKSKLYHLASKTENKIPPKKTEQENSLDGTRSGAGTAPDSKPPMSATPQNGAAGDQVASSVATPDSESTATLSSIPSSSSASLIAFLESRSATFQTSEEEGMAWLVATTVQLRQALITRGLPAKLVEGHPLSRSLISASLASAKMIIRLGSNSH